MEEKNMIESTLDGKTKNITQENIEQLKQLFPEIVTENKIDFEKLKEILGDEIDNTNERYDFTWKGKHEAVKISQTPSKGTLRPSKEDSKNWDTTENLYIEGDNLEVLKLLQKSYYGKIKMIYLDPPYNTGHDFIYEDNFKDNLKNYLKQDQEGFNISSNPETSGRYHTNWLNMMYPRLKLSYNLLTNDGVIFISIDDNEVYNLKKICDEIFGEFNFLGDIIWNSTKSVTNTALISVSHTYNLVYFKNKNYFIKNRDKFRLPDTGEGFDNPDNDPRGPWKADPFQVGGWRPNQQYEIKNPNTGVIYKPNPNCSWKNDYNKFQELIKDNRIVFGKNGRGGPQRKRFKFEAMERGKVSKTLWDDIETTTNGTVLLKKIFDKKNIFDNPKPIELIERMIQLGTNKNDIILDFFSGSSTTAHSTLLNNLKNKNNNKFIMIQLPEKTDEKTEAFKAGYKNICEIGEERIRRVGNMLLKNKHNPDIDIGFKVFKLDSSNLTKWNPDVDNLENSLIAASDNIVEGRSELDLVYEIMLKYGIELTLPVEEISFDKYNFYSVGMGSLVICLNNHVTREVADDVLKIKENLSPDVIRVVFKDNGFESDSDKTNVKEILRNNEVDEFITI